MPRSLRAAAGPARLCRGIASVITMRLTDDEKAMLAGEAGEPRRWAIQHQIAVGEFFDAADLVPVSQAHIMADTESLGEAGVAFLERLAGVPEADRRGRGATLTDPPGLDFQTYKKIRPTPAEGAPQSPPHPPPP